MRVFLFMTILMLLFSQNTSAQTKSENSSVEVLSSKWSKSRQKIENTDNNQPVIPARSALSPTNRKLERDRRANDPVGAIDPNEQTIDARSEALEKNVQEARSPKTKLVDGFLYQAKMRNAGKSAVEVLFWEYQFKERANPSNVVTRQFLCGVRIKPGKEKDLSVFTTFSPSSVISVDSLSDKSGDLFEEKILINRRRIRR